jgi:hypothetical protein
MIDNKNCVLKKFGTLLECEKNVDFLTRKRGFYASEAAGGRKYRKNEIVCNLLIISNNTFKGQKRVCN